MKITLGIADDHQLFLKSLALLIGSLDGFQVVADELDGQSLLEKIAALPTPPDIVLIDVNMPVMDGVETARRISARYPLVRTVALSMKDDDTTIISMLRAGCCAYLLKDIHPNELEKALTEIREKGYYNADVSNINYRRLIIHARKEAEISLSDREREFLRLACSDLTYKHIAAEMNMSERTIDGYRENLFRKFNVQSRVGMAMEAIRRHLVQL
ncbi:MAG TPA: response regulator transcription factor [Puia sp.]|jgi:DNA-binding NarL/FixJ family response regulator|nr:response regulator transcription factor [Puia sp.]